MSETMIPIILFPSFLIAVVLIVKIVSDNRLRHKFVDKGLVDENVKFLYKAEEDRRYSSLKWGFVLIGLGVGFLLSQVFSFEMPDMAILSMVSLFSGLGLVVYYIIVSKSKNRLKQKSD